MPSTPTTDYNLAMDLTSSNTYNTEPDLYTFNFASYSGEFVEGEGNILVLPFSNDIVFEDITRATDKYGNQFLFGAEELIRTNVSCLTYTRNPTSDVSTANYLTRIVTASGDSLVFEYDSETYWYFQAASEKKYFRAPGEDQQCPIPDEERCRSRTKATIPRLKRILSSTGLIVNFSYELARKDVEIVSDSAYLLTRIDVIHKDTLTYEFKYQKINSSIGTYGTTAEQNANNTRMFLSKVIQADGGEYLFSYTNPSGLPDRDSKHIDHWGYYNNANNTTLLPSQLSLNYTGANREPNESVAVYGTLNQISYPTKGYTMFDFEGHRSSTGLYLGGGLRIKSMSSYDFTNLLIEKKNFTYFSGNTGFGAEALNPLYTDMYKTRKEIENVTSASEKCHYYILSHTTVPVHGGTQFNEPFRYSQVEVKHDGVELSGKTLYTYTNVNLVGNSVNPKPDGLNESVLAKEEHFRGVEGGVFQIINKKEYGYQAYRDLTSSYTKVGTTPNYNQTLGFTIRRVLPEQYIPASAETPVALFLPAEFEWNYYSYNSVWYHLSSLKETQYLWSGAVLTDSLQSLQQFFHERPLHAQRTKTVSYSSNGDILTTVVRYPQDYSNFAPGFCCTSKFRGIPVETLHFIGSKLTDAYLTLYEAFNNTLRMKGQYKSSFDVPTELVGFPPSNDPSANPTFTLSNSAPYEKVFSVEAFDQWNNPALLSYSGNQIRSLIWNKQRQLIASCDQAGLADVAYSGFEDSNLGGWSYSESYETNEVFRGVRSLNNQSLIKTGIQSNRTYSVSVWAKDAVPQINNIAFNFAYPGPDGCTLYRHTFTGLSSITIQAAGAKLDEARLHPVESKMNTFNYHPLFGMASQVDGNQRHQKFSYDQAGRLQGVLDTDNNFLIRTDYNYKSNFPED